MFGFSQQSKKEKWLRINLQEAVQKDQIEIYLQPQIGTRDHCIKGFEALIRWKHPLWGTLGPQDFFPEASSLHMIEQFDFLVFDKVCALQHKRLLERKNLFRIACNFSRKAFAEIDFVEAMEQLRSRYKVPARYLAIEILEGSAFSREYRIQKNVKKLSELGYAICLDDCGADNATMSDLTLENIAQIKLDKKLTDHIEQRNVRILLEGICSIAHKMPYEVVCEGVETRRQFELIRDCDVDVVQGYYFYHPLQVEDAEKLFENSLSDDIWRTAAYSPGI